MADFTVISAVSDTLRVMLDAAIKAKVAAGAAAFLNVESLPNSPTLTIFLFEVGEDPSARNQARVRETTPPNMSIRKPPVTLLLRYLLTPWGGDAVTEQKILGITIQTLYNHAILSGPVLQGVLNPTDAALKVTLSPLSLEEKARVWNTMQKAFRLSLSYEVRVVNLDADDGESFKPVTRRTVAEEGAIS
ncbi:MAG: hypothetical protein QOJ88_1008 [Pyrinomonadaceae bacterium]|nr:hypothetical protein [Pyrinomonadaceae bacterium]MDQ1728147.1 hypothetical protein [Pyrinomonadaceae bacterium]